MSEQIKSEWLTTTEAAAYLKVKPRTTTMNVYGNIVIDEMSRAASKVAGSL